MELDANDHPTLKTRFRFDDAALVTDHRDAYRANILVEFGSFLPGEPFQVLDRVSAEILGGKNSFSSPADSQARYQLEEEVRDTTGRARLLPFSARLVLPTSIELGAVPVHGVPLDGSSIDLEPLPELRMILPRGKADDSSQRVWGAGFPFQDIAAPSIGIRTTGTGDGDTSRGTRAHAYPIRIANADGRFRVFPGSKTLEHEAMQGLLAELPGDSRPDPTLTRHPDHCLSLPMDTLPDIDAIRRTHVAFCGLLRATTAHSPTSASILSPRDENTVAGSFCLFRRNDPAPVAPWGTIPFRATGISLAPLLEGCWPRVEHLLRIGLNVAAVSGWLHRGKDISPIEQGFLNLFVFLECLKSHWVSLRARIPMGEISTGFESHVNRTLKDVLGSKKKINSMVEFRNRMVHEGESGLPIRDLVERHCELHRVCTATYLSLIGWTGKWNALRAPPGASPRTAAEEAWWTPPDLDALLPSTRRP